MATIEQKTWILDNQCRFVDWQHPNEGFDAFKDVVDQFISTAIDDMVAEYQGEHIEWLEIMEDGPAIFQDDQDYRAIEIKPTREGPFADPDSRLIYRLYTKLWEDEIGSLPLDADESAFEEVSLQFWGVIGECLRSERAYIALARARTVHKMRLAAYAYSPREGMHFLPDLVDPEFNKHFQHYLQNRG